MNELRIRQWVFTVFSFLWIAILFLDYWDKHPIYWLSIVHFKYTGWLIINLIVAAVISAYCHRLFLFKKVKNPRINGLIIFGIFLFILNLSAFCFNQYLLANLNVSHYFHLTQRSGYTLICALIVLIGAKNYGELLTKYLLQNESKGITKFLINTSLGFFIISLILFGIGLFKLLILPIVLIALLLPSIINYKSSMDLLRRWFWTPYSFPATWTFWSQFMLYFCLVITTLNFFYTQAPFPLGFDARNYYINISQLLAQNGGLIEGFQPYAWNLIASVGYVAFESPEVTMFLCTLGGFLSCWGIYELSVKYFNIKPNLAILSVLVFLITPAIGNHWVIEFKVDLTLLFIQFAILCLLFYWITKKKEGALITQRSDWRILLILSILMGFSLSIKLLSVFLTFGIFLVIWMSQKDRFGTLGIASIGISLPILLRLDEISGLRQYHDHPNRAAYIFILIGIALLGYSIYKHSLEKLIKGLKAIILSGAVMVLCISPWVLKNYHEMPNASIMKIMLGQKPQAKINLSTIQRNYNK